MLTILALAAALAHPDSLAAQIQSRVAAVPGAEIGVYYRRLTDGDSARVDADTIFHAASTMKVPVMIQLFRDVDARRLSLDQPILLVNQFTSIADGSPFVVDSADDSDSTLYHRIGQPVSVRDLLNLMIRRSSSLATNTLIARLDARRVDATAHALGVSRLHVLRGVEDGKAFERGLNNVVTARDLGTLMVAIADNHAASSRACAAMRDVLFGQEFNTEIPAGLPPGTRIAHKTGQITGVLHDAAIVYPAHGPAFVLVVLTRGIPDATVAQSLIADIARLVYARAVATN